MRTALETSVAAALAGGAAALRLRPAAIGRAKADGSPVSDADLAADAAVRAVLAEREPGAALLSEESGGADAERLWIVDPIDGTRDFLAGGPGWAVQVGLAIAGRPVIGAVYLPDEDLCLAGAEGLGAFRIQDGAWTPLAVLPCPAPVLIHSTSRRNRPALDRVLAALPEFASAAETSVGVKVARMLAGRADLSVHPRPIAAWDAAAPAALLLAAGGHASDLAGRPLRLGCTPCPGLVLSLRDDHEALVARLAAAGIAA